MININDSNNCYDGKRVLNNISLSVDKGDYAIIEWKGIL